MNKHTPGPWKVVDKHPQRSAIDIRTNKKYGFDNHIAALYINPTTGQTIDKNGITRKDVERMANARLIAAAPELLEAAKIILELELPEETHGLEELRAAIAKATGKKP